MSCVSRKCYDEGSPGQFFGDDDEDWHNAYREKAKKQAATPRGVARTYQAIPTSNGTEEAQAPHTHKVTKDGFVNVQTSMAIVSGLVMGIAVSGFFAEVPAPPSDAGSFLQINHDFRLMIWCSALFGALMSTGCSVYAIIQAGFMETDDQMTTYISVLNSRWLGGEKTLNFLVVVPFLFMMLAIPQHMFLSHHMHQTNHTVFCLAMCLFLCPLPFAVWFFYLSHKAFKACFNSAPTTNSEAEGAVADMMYASLQKYAQQKGSIFAVQKKEFLSSISALSGEVEREFAEMIFDDWKQKKLKSMLRDEPGF